MIPASARAAMLSVALVASLGCGGKPSRAAKQSKPGADVRPSTTAAAPEPTLTEDRPLTKDEKLRAGCGKCRDRWCRNFEGEDLLAGCFDKPNRKFVKDPYPEFNAHCKAVVDCAYKHNCAFNRARGPVHCYCGSRYVDECQSLGPADDAPCVAEWQAATRSKENMEVLLRFDQVAYPSGWAFHLLMCDRERCGDTSPLGRCTP
jgi:hypothetical protein